MKKLLTAISACAFSFIGTAVQAEAGHYGGGGGGYQQSAPTVYVSGYRHGSPVYTQKIFVGYNDCGEPVFRYRTVSAPRRGYGGGSQHCDTGYNRGGYDRGGYSNYGGRSSGGHVSFSFGR